MQKLSPRLNQHLPGRSLLCLQCDIGLASSIQTRRWWLGHWSILPVCGGFRMVVRGRTDSQVLSRQHSISGIVGKYTDASEAYSGSRTLAIIHRSPAFVARGVRSWYLIDLNFAYRCTAVHGINVRVSDSYSTQISARWLKSYTVWFIRLHYSRWRMFFYQQNIRIHGA